MGRDMCGLYTQFILQILGTHTLTQKRFIVRTGIYFIIIILLLIKCMVLKVYVYCEHVYGFVFIFY